MSLYLKLNSKEKDIFLKVCKSLEVNPDWLYNLIDFESGWNPKATNKYSSAKGLIQFTDSTAKSLGYENSQDLINKNPDISSQLLFPVLQYLQRYKPYPTEQSLYMAVFYPSYRYVDPNTQFPDTVKRYNPQIDTVQSYIDKVKKKPLETNSKLIILPLLILIFWRFKL
jgi:hypothetical protein